MRNELLGTASVNLSNVLKNNGGKSMYDSPLVREGMQPVLGLATVPLPLRDHLWSLRKATFSVLGPGL